MNLSNVHYLSNRYISSFADQLEKSQTNEIVKKVFILALAIFAVIALICTFSKSSPKFILKRDANGLYTLPHFEVPGFKNEGNVRSVEFNIRFGDFILDTKKGILPDGWAIEK